MANKLVYNIMTNRIDFGNRLMRYLILPEKAKSGIRNVFISLQPPNPAS